MWLKVSTEDVVKMDDVRMTVSQDDARMMGATRMIGAWMMEG